MNRTGFGVTQYWKFGNVKDPRIGHNGVYMNDSSSKLNDSKLIILFGLILDFYGSIWFIT